jgi:hypothetical protein
VTPELPAPSPPVATQTAKVRDKRSRFGIGEIETRHAPVRVGRRGRGQLARCPNANAKPGERALSAPPRQQIADRFRYLRADAV